MAWGRVSGWAACPSSFPSPFLIDPHTHTSTKHTQLQTDAAYLLTVLQNLDVPAPPLLQPLHDMCAAAGGEDGDNNDNLLRVLADGGGLQQEEGGEGGEPMGLRAARRCLARRLAEARGPVAGGASGTGV